MTCSDCGAAIEGEEPTCPVCGSRNRSGPAEVAKAVGAAYSVGIRLDHGGPPTWDRRWRKMLLLFDRLEGMYSGATKAAGNEEAEMVVEDFAGAAFHLYEHIEADKSLPQAARDNASAQPKSGPLKMAADMANTDKHHTRTDERPTVRVSSFESDGATGGVAMTVTSVPTTGQPTSVDARDFAADCIGQWRAFLAAHNVPTP